MAQFQFELVSPEKLLVSKSVAMVTLPGGEGHFGVLAGHAPMITTVKAGVIDIYEQNDTTVSDRIFVAGGFAEVTHERCTLLAEEAVPMAELNRAELEAALASLRENITDARTDSARAKAEAELALAEAKLAALAA